MHLRLARFALFAVLPLLQAFPACAAEVSPAAAVGKPFPKLNVQFIGEKPAYEGKARIVEFWATWCPPCRESIPHLNTIYDKFKAKGLVVIGVTSEEKPEVDSFRKKVPMNYSVALDSNDELAKKLGVEMIPQSFVVNKKGVVVWQGSPLDLREATLKKVLSE